MNSTFIHPYLCQCLVIQSDYWFSGGTTGMSISYFLHKDPGEEVSKLAALITTRVNKMTGSHEHSMR